MRGREAAMTRARRWTARLSIRRAAVAAAAVGLAAVALGGAGVRAGAYGTDHLYQITVSENCVNPTACVQSAQNPFGIGGIWGWIEPDSDNTADTAVQFQGHSNSDPTLNGSVHLPPMWDWTIINLSTPPSPFISPPDPNGNYFFFTIPDFGNFEFLTPATPGHYHLSLGPGINSDITVTQMH